MSTDHLGPGSTCPPKQEGKLRLYSMKYCPFVQRVKIVLNAKGVPYDVVDVNLKNKPEWLYKLHPEGRVPALDTGDKIVIESLDISDYLDEKYPEPPLYPGDKAKDKELIAKFGKYIGAYTNALYAKENKTLAEFMEPGIAALLELEEELAKRGTPFFSGEQPGMVDYMIWPWIERSGVLPAFYKDEENKFPREKFTKIIAWKRALQEVKPVKDTVIDSDTHIRFLLAYIKGDPNKVNFENP